MAETPSLNSWQSTWAAYGPVVYHVACSLDPEATETERAAQITAAAAAGFLNREAIDPLAALLDEFLRNRAPSDRRLAAQSLVHLGISIDRAGKVTASDSIDGDSKNTRNSATARKPRRPFFSQTLPRTPLPEGPNTSLINQRPLLTETSNGIATARGHIPTFEEVRLEAGALWQQRRQTLNNNPAPHRPSNETTRTFAPSRADRRSGLEANSEVELRTRHETQEREQQFRDATQARLQRRRRTALGILAFLLLGGLAGRKFSPVLLDRVRNSQSPPLLTVKDPPKQWELTFASSHQPAKIVLPTEVFQRFDSFDNRHTMLVTTTQGDRRFADSSLGTPRNDRRVEQSTALTLQARATATDSFPVHTPANEPVLMEWKQPMVPFTMNQSATVVRLEAWGMPSSDVQSLGRNLRARPNLLAKGWSTPPGFFEQIVLPKRDVLDGHQSSLVFRSTIDGKTRVLLQMRPTYNTTTIDTGDLSDRPEKATLPSGRIVRFSRAYTHNYGWTESGYEFSAIVSRNDRDDRSAISNQQSEYYFSRLEPLPNRHVDGVLDLIDRVRLGTDEQWRSLNAGYQRSLQQLPVLESQQLGGHQIVTRTLPNTNKGATPTPRTPFALCAYSVCTPIYGSWDGTALEADLLIDDHWWHFRQIANYDKTVPKYFTSPAVASVKTGEANFDRIYHWWGIDFGTKVTAARNDSESQLLLRPLPR